MRGTMMDYQLTIRMLLEHGARFFGTSTVGTFTGEGVRRATYAEVAGRAERLAAALARLGVRPGDRVGTLAWNNQAHLEAYLAIPSMGAVLHTLNLRLFPDQLAYVINHAEDKVIIVDGTLVPLLARVASQLRTVERYVVVGEGPAEPLGEVLRYEELLAAEAPGFAWPDVDERQAAGMCYTTGTTGDPKGVVYEHRSMVLHSWGVLAASGVGLTDRDKLLPVVPMFHAMAWGMPHAAWFVGSDIILPDRFLQAEFLCQIIGMERPTVSAAVPTIWNDVLRHAERHPVDFSSLRLVVCGGSAVPRALIERFQERHGVRIVQGWGMTETSPLAALAHPPKGVPAEAELDYRAKTGRPVGGVEVRLVDDAGNELPWDGKAVGEIEVRGPWVTATYYQQDAPERFHDGWLRTGDVGTIDERGYLQITDRAKDVIKSGGEWISSVELENTLMAHPAVAEAAVIGVSDERWQERPLACVVVAEGQQVTAEELRDFLAGKVARWWLPERWAFVSEIPKTSVGKFDKKVLRARHAEGRLDVIELARSG